MTDRGMEIRIRNLREFNRLRLIGFVSDFVLRIADFEFSPVVSDFDAFDLAQGRGELRRTRYSDFGFRFAGEKKRRDEDFLGDLPSMQRRVLLSLSRAPAQEDQAPLSLLQPPVFRRGEPQDR